MSIPAEASQRRSRWLKRRIGLRVVVGLAFLAILIRYTLSVLETEIGLQSEVTDWRNATVGLLGLSYEPVGWRMPTEQADYWLAETERVTSADGVISSLVRT